MNLTSFVENWHLSVFTNIPASTRAAWTLSTCPMFSSTFADNIFISSRCTKHVFQLYCSCTATRALWNDEGSFVILNVIRTNSYSPSENKILSSLSPPSNCDFPVTPVFLESCKHLGHPQAAYAVIYSRQGY